MGAERPADSAYLYERTLWLIRLRVLFVVAMTVVATGAGVLGVVRGPGPLVLLGAVFGLNGLYWVASRRLGPDDPPARLRAGLLVQLMVDAIALTAVLHYSDTVENPFVMFYAFPMVIGAIVLDRRQALILVCASCLLHAGFALLEHSELIPHHPLHLEGLGVHEAHDEVLESSWFVATHILAVSASLFGVVMLVRSVAEQRLRAEAIQHEHAQLALSREKLAHVGEVSAGVAHAVRNPVHGLMNCVELLDARVGDDPEIADTLGMMTEALRRIEGVTRRLLVLMHDGPLRPTPTDLDALVDDSLKFMSGRAKPKNVRIVKELGSVGQADVDPDRFSEALINVLDNAVDASHEGGTVTVRTAHAGADGLLIEVRDEGSGMSDEQLTRVFHPFFTTKPVGQGTGLGLAISKRILEEHGGDIQIESAPQRGTSVRLSVARARTVIALHERPS